MDPPCVSCATPGAPRISYHGFMLDDVTHLARARVRPLRLPGITDGRTDGRTCLPEGPAAGLILPCLRPVWSQCTSWTRSDSGRRGRGWLLIADC